MGDGSNAPVRVEVGGVSLGTYGGDFCGFGKGGAHLG